MEKAVKRFYKMDNADWDSTFQSVVQSVSDDALLKLSHWMCDNMDAVKADREVDDEAPKLLRAVDGPASRAAMHLVTYAALLQWKSRAFTASGDTMHDILGVAEFAFLVEFPELNSYSSYYVPMYHLFNYLAQNKNDLMADK